jgi:hypothetical protein
MSIAARGKGGRLVVKVLLGAVFGLFAFLFTRLGHAYWGLLFAGIAGYCVGANYRPEDIHPGG